MIYCAGITSLQHLVISVDGIHWSDAIWHTIIGTTAPLQGQGFRLLEKMKLLRTVKLACQPGGFMGLRHEDLAFVMQGLPDLRALQICGYNQLSSDKISALQQRFPRVHLDLSSLVITSQDSDLRTGQDYH